MDNHDDGQTDSEKDADGDILPRFKGLPNITEGVENIHTHLLKRHVYLYPEDGTHRRWVSPQIIVLFATGNVSQVVEAAVKDLKHPIGTGLVASILVQEPLRQTIIRKIRARMELMDERIPGHPNFLNSLKLIERMNCKTVYIEEFDPADKQKLYGRMKPRSPIIVLDFPQVYFGDKPTAIITLNTFRSLNEAVKLCNREGLAFETVSVWTNKLTEGYDMVSGLPRFSNFRFNCINVPFKANAMVTVKDSYHYEVLAASGELTTIAFPIQHEF
ncbi:uncharacterized protein LOC115768347 [Drosophila novamexicana]|uniref:uncharacterized protein LOC115768347 n=1 Tax=Drosophila novamexicana TaxID=47314 RepID=UPI0011E59ECB|nr:uncharacterized protein LOC115768347 [Drosophila novamexicana]